LSDEPLDETLARVKQHWAILAQELRNAMPRAEHLSIDAVAGGVTGVLRSANSLPARRQRGGNMPAVPLLVGQDETARYRVGYLEEWEERPGRRLLRFKAANLTFFITPPDDAPAIQLFRAEWPGLREWTRGVVGYQSPGAGHPHWQFDALDHYMSEEQRRASVRRVLSILQKPREAPEEFGPESLETATKLVVEEEAVDTSWTAFHFAAGARWPKQPWQGPGNPSEPHVWAPGDLMSIRQWVRSVVIYARQELLKASTNCKL
jgi:hypothetical protein